MPSPKEASEIEEINSDINQSPFRPVAIFNYLIARTPRLIGWNDDEIRAIDKKMQMERIRQQEEVPGQTVSFESPDVKLMKKAKEDVQKFGFGVMGMTSKLLLKKMFGADEEIELSSTSEDTSRKVWLPRDGDDVKDHELYKHLLTAARYQRDAYFMGAQHAELRKSERAADMAALKEILLQRITELEDDGSHAFFSANELLKPPQFTYHELMRKYPTLEQSPLGLQQLSNISQWFIPSKTMHNSLLPTVLWSVSTPNQNYTNGGPLYRQVSRSLINLVPLSQTIVDSAVKNSVLYVLRDQNIKGWAKGATNGYVSNMQRDAEDENITGKFVTTKTIDSTT